MSNEIEEDIVATADELFHRVLFYHLRTHRSDMLSEELSGLSLADLHILRAVARTPNMILKDIRQITGLPHSTLTGIVDRLEEKGLLRRVISRRDLRSYGLELTDTGREVEAKHGRVDRLYTERVLYTLDEDERQTMLCLFEKISEGLGSVP